MTVFTVSGSVHPSSCRLVSTHRPKNVEPTCYNKLISHWTWH